MPAFPTKCVAVSGWPHDSAALRLLQNVEARGTLLADACACTRLPCCQRPAADLNPNNVLLKHDANAAAGVVPKVADFGLSVLLPEKASHMSNLRQGTPFYMAPEVVLQASTSSSLECHGMALESIITPRHITHMRAHVHAHTHTHTHTHTCAHTCAHTHAHSVGVLLGSGNAGAQGQLNVETGHDAACRTHIPARHTFKDAGMT